MTPSAPATTADEKGLQFEFATSHRILFGRGQLNSVGAAARLLGSRALIISGRSPERADRLEGLLKAAGLLTSRFSVAGEPTVPEVLQACREAASGSCDLLVGIGGGSAMDAAKAVAALLANPGEPLDFLEVVGKGQPLKNPSLPCITLPTTAGSGAEVTRNAVLSSPEHRVKVSLRGHGLLSRLAIVDPDLTLGLPPELTASTGLDALTQLIEPYVSVRANPITDGFCLDGLRRVARSLEKCWMRPNDIASREDMSMASLQGGLALANSGLGAIHGLAGAIGGMWNAPHGAVCAALLAPVTEVNIHALRHRLPNSVSLSRYRYVARILSGKEEVSADAAVAWTRDLVHRLGLPRLRDLGVSHEHFPTVIEKGLQSSSMKGNPIALTVAELKGALDRAW